MQNKELELTKGIYSRDVLKEWDRLVKDPVHRLEFDTTMRFLKKHLPKKGLILDAGGGPGRYTIELAKLGYDVVLFDLVRANLELAEEQIKKAKVGKHIKGIVEGTITDLAQFKNNSFDAVICLGSPLSHVHPAKEREQSIAELVRVGKKNAPIFVSVTGKFGPLANLPVNYVNEIEVRKHFMDYALRGDDRMWRGGYMHKFELNELKELFRNKVRFMESVGLEGLASVHPEAINEMAKNKNAWKNWMEAHYALCTHPTVVDISMHMMIVGNKK